MREHVYYVLINMPEGKKLARFTVPSGVNKRRLLLELKTQKCMAAWAEHCDSISDKLNHILNNVAIKPNCKWKKLPLAESISLIEG